MKIKKFPLILNPPPMPIVGFILQKDVYTTNLLYANDKFSTKSLRKKLPFRPPYIKNNDPNSCITILHNKKNNLNIKTEYTFKPKKLMHRRLKFPLPKMKTVPLNESILNGEICKQNISLYLKNIYKEEELNKEATTEKSSVVQKEGDRQVTRPIKSC